MVDDQEEEREGRAAQPPLDKVQIGVTDAEIRGRFVEGQRAPRRAQRVGVELEPLTSPGLPTTYTRGYWGVNYGLTLFSVANRRLLA